jgi:hypothetical protein
MKRSNKFLTAIMAIIMVFSLLPSMVFAESTASSGTCGDNVTWSLDDGTLTISGTGDMEDYNRNSPLPWYSKKSSIKSVVIKSGVTSIGNGAFSYCTSLEKIEVDSNNKNYTSVDGVLFNKEKTTLIRYPEGKNNTTYEIPNGVTSIGDSAFPFCNSLTSVTIPNSVTSIGNSAFFGCDSLASVTIPDSVTSIGNEAFSSCDNLASVTIGNGVTSIGDGAFDFCSSLTSVTIPSGVTSIGRVAFASCTSLEKIEVDSNNNNYTSVDGVLFDKEKTTLVQYPVGNDRTTYEIPNGVTSIENKAFYSCDSLTSVTIPSGVTSIGRVAFAYCTSLEKIEVGSNNKNYISVDGVLFDKEKTTLVQYPGGNDRTTYEIPNSVTNIGDMAFYGCRSLTSVTIPNSVTSIGDMAFSSCRSLTNVTIPDSITSIGNGTFYWCSNLTSVTIPNSVTSIGDRAFLGCISLTDVYYTGSEDEWDSISMGVNDDKLTNATIHYNSVATIHYNSVSENSQSSRGIWNTITDFLSAICQKIAEFFRRI